MTLARTLAALVVAAFAAPAFAAPVLTPAPSGERLVLVQKGEEHGKKKAKGQEAKKNADRSNKGGETRGAERVDQVQGMQDTGKGAGKRKQ
jgi:hypothetical protein